MKKKLKGTGVALVTPFHKQGTIDFGSLGKLIEHTISNGVNYLVVLGTTGEAATLSKDEKNALIQYVKDQVAQRCPLVLGMGGYNTQEVINNLQVFDPDGFDAILSVTPYYNKPSQRGLYLHYKHIASASPLPVILYNVPGRTRSNMEWETTVRLAEYSKTFVGIKEASGDLIQTTRIIKNKPEHFIVTSGDDEVALPMTAVGGDGVISVMANAFPKAFSQMINFALDQDYFAARELNFKTYDLHKWLYIEGNPVGIKSAMEILGYGTNEVRLPLAPLSDGNYAKLKEEVLKIVNTLDIG